MNIVPVIKAVKLEQVDLMSHHECLTGNVIDWKQYGWLEVQITSSVRSINVFIFIITNWVQENSTGNMNED